MVKIAVFCGVAPDRCDVDKKCAFWWIMYSSGRRVFWLPDSIRRDSIGGFFVGGVIRNFFLWRWDKLGAVVFVCFLSSGAGLRWGWYFLGAR